MDTYFSLKRAGRESVLAVCDCGLLGRTLRGNGFSFHVNRRFYGGKRATVEEALSLIPNATSVNLVGKHVVSEAIRRGYVHPEAVLTVNGVPHALIVRV